MVDATSYAIVNDREYGHAHQAHFRTQQYRPSISGPSPLSSSPQSRAASDAETKNPSSNIEPLDFNGAPLQETYQWWWWWEILASAVSIISMGLVVLLVFEVNNKPLRQWKLQIQPTTALAVLTTVAQTSMMVAVTSCLSQLKWQHFTNPRPLSHLQLFDDASRGPWGSLGLLYNLRARSFLAYSLAIATLIGLGIGPTSQQILNFQSIQTALTNTTAEIGVAKTYASRGFDRSK
jgi:hypothetical protein